MIHTVGPVWGGGGSGEPELLRACYTNSLALAVENDIATIAFPSISTGIYGYPMDEAAGIAVSAVRGFATDGGSSISTVTFCCFSAGDLAVYEQLLEGRG